MKCVNNRLLVNRNCHLVFRFTCCCLARCNIINITAVRKWCGHSTLTKKRNKQSKLVKLQKQTNENLFTSNQYSNDEQEERKKIKNEIAEKRFFLHPNMSTEVKELSFGL